MSSTICTLLQQEDLLPPKSFKKMPFLFTGWFWFLGTLVPVIGLELSTAEIQESMRALLEQYQQVVVERAPGTEAVRLTGGRVRVSTRLFGNAKRWKTTDARAAFKDVLDLAATAPQVVERDGRELLIIDRELLQRFEKPLSGAELVERLSQNPLEPLVFQKELEREPPPAIRAFEGA